MFFLLLLLLLLIIIIIISFLALIRLPFVELGFRQIK